MHRAAASLPKTRVWGSDLPDPSIAPREPPVLAAFRIWPGVGVTTTTRRPVPDYLRARYYDPSTAQFLTRDPAVAKTRTPYAYVYDDPLNLTDPSGLDCNGFDPGCWARHAAAAATGAIANGVGWVHDHATVGVSGCVVMCMNLQLQAGKLSLQYGATGWFLPSPYLGYHNALTQDREKSSFMGGFGPPHPLIPAVEGSCGFTGSGLNTNDWEADISAGKGWYGGFQATIWEWNFG
jgi:hypothetical protein